MLPPPTYYLLLNLCLLYALLKGGRAERLGAAILVVGTVASLLAASGRFHSLEVGLVLVDVAVPAAFILLALRADRYWPIWASALAGLGLLAHLGRWSLGPGLEPRIYLISIAVWSYLILAAIAIGTFNHGRGTRGLDELAAEPDSRP